jgi:hypothetical protein
MAVRFTPTFTHTPWVDNRDRVQAGGPNGFNIRFAQLQSDLQTLAGVVTTIDTTLDELAQAPAAQARVISIPPMFSPTAGNPSWQLDRAGYAVKPGPQVSLTGIAPLVVPNGVQLSRLRASGQNSGAGRLRVDLMRARLLGAPGPAELIARVTGDADPFDVTVNANSAMATVDTTTFRYFILATLDGAAVGDTVSLAGFQVTYLA